MNKKIVMLSTFILGLVFITMGLSYSLFIDSRTSKNTSLVVGNIYMHYNETKEINIENAMPSDTYDKNNYFEFTIDGKNTSNNDIYYEIILNHGNEVEEKTRIEDKFLKFTLTEIVDGTEKILIDNKSCNRLNDSKIWIDTINKNTTEEIKRTYRLYIFIGDNVLIGNINQDYTMEEWEKIYATIKVDVSGDFIAKDLETEGSCFSTVINNNKVMITDYDISCGSNVVIPSKIDGLEVTSIGVRAFESKNLTSVKIPDTLTSIEPGAFLNNNISSIVLNDDVYVGYNAFDNIVAGNKDLAKNVTAESCFSASLLKDGTVAITDYDESCGLDVVIPSTISGYVVTTIKGNENLDIVRELNTKTNSTFNDLNYYHDKDIIVRKVIPEPSGIEGAFVESRVKRIVLPDTLKIVKKYAFFNANITSIDLGNSLETIEEDAFYGVALQNLVVPDSVLVIGNYAFNQGKLDNIQVGSGLVTLTETTFATGMAVNSSTTNITLKDIKYIDELAFTRKRYINLKSITINKKCSDIKNIQGSSTNTTKYYPWFESTTTNITIYGLNKEICDSY